MSETVHYRGKLTKVEKQKNESLKQLCERLMERTFDVGNDEWKYSFEDKFYDESFIYEDDVYDINYTEVDADEDVFRGSKNEDGSVNFETKFYNGGCSFTEALGDILDSLREA